MHPPSHLGAAPSGHGAAHTDGLATLADALRRWVDWLDQHGAALAAALGTQPTTGTTTGGAAGEVGGATSATAGAAQNGPAGSGAPSGGLGGALTDGLQRLHDGFGTLQSNAADTLQHTIVAGLNATSAALTQALFHTRDWGRAFLQLGEQVVQMLIQVALKMAVVSALQGAFGFTGFFANGGPIAPAAFASGGPTADDLPILTSAGEYILRASAATTLGSGFLAAANQGVVDLSRLNPGARVAGLPPEPSLRSGAARNASPAATPQIHLHVHSDPAAALKGALATTEGQAAVVDLTRRKISLITPTRRG